MDSVNRFVRVIVGKDEDKAQTGTMYWLGTHVDFPIVFKGFANLGLLVDVVQASCTKFMDVCRGFVREELVYFIFDTFGFRVR